MVLSDPFLNICLETSEIIETVDLTDEIKGVFMRAKQATLPMVNYIYILFCYNRESGEISYTVNLETTSFGTCCLGANSKNCHYNFGPANENMAYEDFKKKAIEIARKLIAEGSYWENIKPEDIKPFLVD